MSEYVCYGYRRTRRLNCLLSIVYEPLAPHGENERRSIQQWTRFAQSVRLVRLVLVRRLSISV